MQILAAPAGTDELIFSHEPFTTSEASYLHSGRRDVLCRPMYRQVAVVAPEPGHGAGFVVAGGRAEYAMREKGHEGLTTDGAGLWILRAVGLAFRGGQL